MACIVGKNIVLCGDFYPADSDWHDMGYLGIMHRCSFCSLAARFVNRGEGRKDRYWCGKCEKEDRMIQGGQR